MPSEELQPLRSPVFQSQFRCYSGWVGALYFAKSVLICFLAMSFNTVKETLTGSSEDQNQQSLLNVLRLLAAALQYQMVWKQEILSGETIASDFFKARMLRKLFNVKCWLPPPTKQEENSHGYILAILKWKRSESFHCQN